jgi:hypothetical protein
MAVSLHAVVQMNLPDGRQLGYQAIGAEGCAEALMLHGTPGSSRQPAVTSPRATVA